MKATLQQRIGGTASALAHDALVASAEHRLSALAPQINNALEELRRTLRSASAQSELDLHPTFVAAHEIRSLAGSVGRGSISTLADVLASYVKACENGDAGFSVLVVTNLVSAIDRAFDVKEDDPWLHQVVTASGRMVRCHTRVPT